MSDQKDHEQPEVNEENLQVEAVDNADTEEPAEAEQISPELQIEALEQALGEAKESVLRAQADAINAQRRAEKEIEKARKFALEGFSREVLVVADNLERALSVVNPEDESVKPIVEGIELTLKSFSDVLAKFNVEAVDPHGEPFDPQLHQAMSIVPNPEVEPNTVIAVMQKGYTLNGRLIRPAMVMVSKAD
ncbi:nucleotide exchange factor GrpE [Aequoribacter sp.]|uniref:nucleotide exchange factor GrpE n=1 Tax=Aequoribacter sp. TaxID=2847771 RepID=UPI003C3E7500